MEREYDLSLISLSLSGLSVHKKGEQLEIHSPSQLPELQYIDHIAEPISRLTLHLPERFVGPVLKLCEDRRGTQVNFEYAGTGRIVLTYDIPYAEVVYDFFDRLKSCSRLCQHS